jgi:hypothetical protein
VTCVDPEPAAVAALHATPGATSMLAVARPDLRVPAEGRVAKLYKMLKEDGPWKTVGFLRVRQLRKQLWGYRRLLTAAWSAETCYQPFLEGFQNSPVRSFGQCGVTSAWLIPQLNWHRRWRATYCVGYVVFDGGRDGQSESHCWVEIRRPAGRLVIDLTFDQFGYRDRRKVLCAPHRKLLTESIEYRREGKMRFRHLRNDDVWQRYQILLEATGEKVASDRRRSAVLAQQ